MSKLDWAMWAVENTPFYVFPLRPNSKKPLYRGAGLDGTRDPEKIKVWWAITPDANIGISYFLSGHALIECDIKDPLNNGYDTWLGLWRERGEEPPETLTFTSRSGGPHYVFTDAEGYVKVDQNVWPGIDTRGVGGLGVGPGSTIDGKEYGIGAIRPIAPLPAWIRDHVGGKTYIERQDEARKASPLTAWDTPLAVEAAREAIGRDLQDGPPRLGVDSDGRTYAICCRLLDLGLRDDTILDLLKEEWHSSYDRGWYAEKLHNAHGYRENAVGCDRPRSGQEIFGEAIEAASVDGKLPESGLLLLRGDRVQVEAIEWLWDGWLAQGKLHILGGQKGAGKSTTTFDLAASITLGSFWPDGTRAPRGSVLIWSSEDDFNDTILPRFLAANGDATRVYAINMVRTSDGQERYFDPATDSALLLKAAAGIPDLKLIIIDPIVSAVGGDSHKNSEVRRALQPLVNLAGECGAAIVGITHFTKGTQGRSPTERITGSIAFSAIARIVLGAVKNEEDEEAPRRLVRISSNIGPSGDGFEYTLARTPVPAHAMVAQTIEWGVMVKGSAGKLIGEVEDGTATRGKLSEAMSLLREMLNRSPDGVLKTEAVKGGDANGISARTMQRAWLQMDLEAYLSSVRKGWVWREKSGTARFDA